MTAIERSAWNILVGLQSRSPTYHSRYNLLLMDRTNARNAVDFKNLPTKLANYDADCTNPSLKKQPPSESATPQTSPQTRGTHTLPIGFLPRAEDIICGNEFNEHEGNVRFRELLATFAKPYCSCTSKDSKRRVVRDILKVVRNRGSLIVRIDSVSGLWVALGDSMAICVIEKLVHSSIRKRVNDYKESRRRASEAALAPHTFDPIASRAALKMKFKRPKEARKQEAEQGF